MAKAVRIFSAAVNSDGTVDIRFNAGEAPVSGQWGGDVMTFASRQDLIDRMTAAQESVNVELLLLLGVADGWTKLDPSASNPANLRAREVQLDLAGAATPIRIQNR